MVIYKKKQAKLIEGDPDDLENGDVWIYISKKSDTKLELAHSTGKRIQETADDLITKTKQRGELPTKENQASFRSDGNDQYTKALLNSFDEETINYGQMIKERESGRVVGKTRKIIIGDMDVENIDTVYIERYNNTIRHNVSRLVRRTLCFSKCKDQLDNHLDAHQCYHNFMRTPSTLTIKTEKGYRDIERTPCMAEGITDHIWDWNELLRYVPCHEN